MSTKSRRITSAFEQQGKAVTNKSTAVGATPKEASRGLLHHHQSEAAAAQPTTPNPAEVEADERTLRQFDLDSKFGPWSGMSRLERFERATKLNLNPPEYVRQLIAKHGGDTSDLNRHVFSAGKV